MDNAEAENGHLQDPTSDAQSTVCLLAVESINDLHNVPLTTGDPPAMDGSIEWALPALPSSPGIRARVCDFCCQWMGKALVVFIVFIIVAAFSLALYLTYQKPNRYHELQRISEMLDAVMELLHQVVANQRYERCNATQTIG